MRNAYLFALSTLLLPALASAGSTPLLLGDVTHGDQLYAACPQLAQKIHPQRSGEMCAIRDAQLFELVKSTCGELPFLDRWDVVAAVRDKHLSLARFFPGASRYVAKKYAIDKHGLGRIREATKAKLPAFEAVVYTFFTFPDEEGQLRYVPQDPIQLDALKRDKKRGYLVFVPLALAGGPAKELAVAMDAAGVIRALAVNDRGPEGAALNARLAQFVGQGKKGLRTPLKAKRADAALGKAAYLAYLTAMESATMFDREERERTWADDAIR